MRKLLKLTNGANRRPDRAMGDETTPCGQLLSLCSVLPYGSHNDVTLLSVGTLAQPTSERSAVRPENRGFVMKTFTGKSRLGLLMCLAGVMSIVAPKARADEQHDPPTRVARISYVDGSVSLQPGGGGDSSEEHTSELQSHLNLVCRLLLEKKKKKIESRIVY